MAFIPMIDLFGETITEAAALARPKRPKKTGHAAPSGSGPAGQTCRTCRHYCRLGGHAKTYRKCGLARHAWTNGPGTDIRASDPACRLWNAEKL